MDKALVFMERAFGVDPDQVKELGVKRKVGISLAELLSGCRLSPPKLVLAPFLQEPVELLVDGKETRKIDILHQITNFLHSVSGCSHGEALLGHDSSFLP